MGISCFPVSYENLAKHICADSDISGNSDYINFCFSILECCRKAIIGFREGAYLRKVINFSVFLSVAVVLR
jgi:hypothetical protein